MKIAIVVPCHIPPTKKWVKALDKAAIKGMADVIIVDDSNGKLGKLPKSWRVYDYKAQEKFLKVLYSDFSKFFHKSSACRVFGHIVAYAENYDVIIGLDSDCVVPIDFVESHTRQFSQKTYGWTNPLADNMSLRPDGLYSRGYPYSMRDWPVVANMGLWDVTLDLNGKDRGEKDPRLTFPRLENLQAVAPIPFSGMNFALRRETIPGFLFLPNFDYTQPLTLTEALGIDGVNNKVWKFRRIDDIWGGYIFQRLSHQRHEGVMYGYPVVDHISEVDAAADAAEEEAMYKWEERFIAEVDKCIAMANNLINSDKSYAELFRLFVCSFNDPVFKNLIPAMDWWVKVWRKYG